MVTACKTVAVVTGTRADFGLLVPVLRAMGSQDRLRTRLLVTGLHWIQDTWRDVEAAGFRIDARAPMQEEGRSGRWADVEAAGRGVSGLGRALADLEADAVLVLGDRIEAFAAAAAGSIGGLHVAHIHGGDRAEGVADEAMRHAVSKLAHLHFAASAQSRRRLIRMGERPEHVFNVGSPAIDGLAGIVPADDATLTGLGLPVDTPYLVVLQHPSGAAEEQERAWMRQTLAATTGWPRLVLGPNHDPGRGGVMAAMEDAGVCPVTHLPRPVFLAVLKRAGALVGNSSAGLIEAAAVRGGGVPVVNIGDRQAGRERSSNVIDCGYGERSVAAAVARAMATPRPGTRFRHPFGRGAAGERIARRLAQVDLASVPLRKRNTY